MIVCESAPAAAAQGPRLSVLDPQLMRTPLGIPLDAVCSQLKCRRMLKPLSARIKEIVRLARISCDPLYLRNHKIRLSPNSVEHGNRHVVVILCLQHPRDFHHANQVFNLQLGQPRRRIAFHEDIVRVTLASAHEVSGKEIEPSCYTDPLTSHIEILLLDLVPTLSPRHVDGNADTRNRANSLEPRSDSIFIRPHRVASKRQYGEREQRCTNLEPLPDSLQHSSTLPFWGGILA
ncbi:hypothetical protein GA0116996_101615 [Cupriavidus alkaliphilus]|nr:hypothetical protein GA0116996_101615 [Cupriavidus alkaliphilus]